MLKSYALVEFRNYLIANNFKQLSSVSGVYPRQGCIRWADIGYSIMLTLSVSKEA